MYNSAFYKLDARNLLRGNFKAALIASVIFMIPTYLLSLVDHLFMYSSQTQSLNYIQIIIDILFSIFVLNIMYVGYYRFILSLKKHSELPDTEENKGYSYDTVLSGFTKNYKNTLKITFLMNLYVFCWGLFALIPLMLLTGLIAYLAATTDIISTIYSMSIQLSISPSPDMLANVSEYITQNCPYLPIVTILSFLLTIPASIPLILKYYEYAAIPMIVADNPEITVKKAFKRTRDIMTGYKFRYFALQLSFILYIIGTAIILLFTQSLIIYYIAVVFLQPYISAAMLSFYKERNGFIEYNISVYGEN